MSSRHATGTARLALLAGALALGACRGDGAAGDPPQPRSVTPDHGPVSTPVSVVIRGDFHPRVTTDFTGAGGNGVDARFTALLGPVPLDGVRLRADGAIEGTVPAGLATGSYDLTVVDGEGRPGTLPGAYRVVPDAAAGALVASFRIDPLGPQRAMQPFAVTITALDAQGQPVTDFNGSAQLADLTGTAVPDGAGLFVNGRWTGLVEVRAAHVADVLTASDGLGHLGQSGPFPVLPSPAAVMRFVTPPRTSQAGACSGAGQPVTVEILDAFGAPTQAEADIALAVAGAPAAGFEVFADPACATPAAPLVAAGASTATVYLRGTRSGAVSLTASAPSLAPASQAVTVLPGPPAAAVFTTTPQTVNAGACSQAVTVEIQDAFGNPSPPGGAALDLSAPAAGFALFSDPGCSVPATGVTLAPGATQASFWFQGTTAQMATVTVGGGALGLTPASQDEIVLSEGSATRLVVLTPAQTVTAGSCSDQVTLQAQDSFGNAVTGIGAEQVTLSAPPSAGLAFFSDPACSVPASVIQIGAGQSTTGFWFRGTVASGAAWPSGVPVTVASASLTDAVQNEVVVPAPPARLEFTTAPVSVAAGACSGLATVGLRDAFGNASPAASALAVGLAAAPSGGVTFFADALCATPATQVTVPAGGTAAVFAFKATQAGSETVTASAAGLIPASQDQTVHAATPDRLVFTSAPQAVVAGACSGAVSVQARDPWDNPAPVPSATAVALSAVPVAGFRFFADAACATPATAVTIPPGQASATFFFSGTAAGSVAATASAAGWAPASQAETVAPAAADHLVFLSTPQVVTAGDCSGAVTVEARDAYENPASQAGGASVGLSAAPAGLAFHAGVGCSGASVSSVAIAAGATSATFSFRGTAAGSVAVTASSPALSPVTQAETVNAAAADHLTFTTPPQTRQAGACSAAVTMQSQDPYGNASAVAVANAVTLAAAPSPGFTFYSDGACAVATTAASIGAGSSAATFWFKGTVAGPVTVTATPAGLSGASQVETVTAAGTPSQLAFLGAPQSVTAGACSAKVTVQAQDTFGNPQAPAGGATVSLTAPPGAGLVFYAGTDPACAGPPVVATSVPNGGTSADFYFRGTLAGSPTITAASALLNPATQTQTVMPAAADHLVFTTPPQTRQAGVCSAAATAQSQDAFGNVSSVVSAMTVTLSASPATGFTFYADAGCTATASSTNIPAGSSTAGFYFKGTVAGSVTVTATVTGWSPSPTQVETVSPAPPDHLVFATPPLTATAGSCSAAVTVESRDASGNVSPVSAPTAVSLSAAPPGGFTFYSDAGCTSPVASVVIPASGTSAAFRFVATTAGTVAVAAAAAGMSPSPTQVETVGAAAPDRLAFTSAPQALAAGACSAAVSLESRDAYGNVAPVPTATSVNLSAAPASGFALYADASCSAPASTATLAAGQSAAGFWFRGTAAGGVAVAASVPGWVGPVVQTETVNPGNPDHFTWDALASPQACNIPFAVTVRAVDVFGNATPTFTGTASLTLSVSPPVSPVPTMICTSGCIAGNSTGPFTAGVWTGGVAVGSPATPAPPGTPDRSLVAASGSLTGQSAAFVLQGARSPSPPVARLTASPAVIRVNQSVSFDASGSFDYETAASLLRVSWDFQGVATSAQQPGAAPWTGWSTAKTSSNTYTAAGTYYPRLAVQDETGAIGYATVRVVVLAAADPLCLVNTPSDADDGASSCACAGAACGADQKLSLREAARLAADGTTIAFSGAMTITGTTAITIGRKVRVVAPPGVVLDSVPLAVNAGDAATPVLVAGVEVTRQTTAPAISLINKANLVLEDAYLHDAGGATVPVISDRGTLTLTRVRMANCASSCVAVTDGSNADTLTVRFSDFRGAGGIALDVQQCQPNKLAAVVRSNTFTGYAQAIRLGCSGSSTVINNTFEANGTGVAYPPWSTNNHGLRNNVFTNQTVSAANCGAAGFTNRDYHVLFGNASNGCLGSDPFTLTSDPQYVFPVARDYRLQAGSPSIDSALDLGLYLLPAFPSAPGPLFLGAGPDRGGQESF